MQGDVAAAAAGRTWSDVAAAATGGVKDWCCCHARRTKMPTFHWHKEGASAGHQHALGAASVAAATAKGLPNRKDQACASAVGTATNE
eukprot:297080-Chlamydomonas_euryale.AAC.1